MKTGLLQNRDLLAGLLFIAIGSGGFLIALSYPFGTIDRMGPGYFPRVLGTILIAFGLVTAAKGLRSGAKVDGPWGWFPLSMLAASLVAFGWLMERTGLIPALIVLIVTSAWAGKEFRWGEVAVLTAVMCLMAVAIFIWGLGLPYPLYTLDFGR